MNIKEFLKNPVGKGAVIPGKNTLLADLDKRYKALLERKEFEFNIYRKKDCFFFHFLIMTEDPERENDYDVVIGFYPTKTQKFDTVITRYDIKIFSNSPSFIYTYAYVAKQNKLLIVDFYNKFDVNVLKKPPVSRNPGKIMGYEKSVYYACKYLVEHENLLNKAYAKNHSDSNYRKLIKEVRRDSVILQEIKTAKAIKQAKKYETRKQDKIEKSKINHIGKSKRLQSSVNYINKINNKNKGGKITHVGKSKKTKSSVNVIKKKR